MRVVELPSIQLLLDLIEPRTMIIRSDPDDRRLRAARATPAKVAQLARARESLRLKRAL